MIPKTNQSKKQSLKLAHPEKYAKLLKGLREGKTIRQVALEAGVSYSCVQHHKFELAKELPALRASFAKNWSTFVQRATDRMVNEVDSMSIDKLPVAAAIAQDKLMLLAGEPSSIQRVEHADLPGSNDIIDMLPAANVCELSDADTQVTDDAQESNACANRCSGGRPGEGVDRGAGGNNDDE